MLRAVLGVCVEGGIGGLWRGRYWGSVLRAVLGVCVEGGIGGLC